MIVRLKVYARKVRIIQDAFQFYDSPIKSSIGISIDGTELAVSIL